MPAFRSCVALLLVAASPILASRAVALDVGSVVISPKLSEELDRTYGVDEVAALQQLAVKAIGATPPNGRCGAAQRVDVVIEDAAPTHPTPRQLSEQPQMDFLRSKSLGGATLRAALLSADGRVVASVDHRHYAQDLRLTSRAADAWADANIAFEQLADKIAGACRGAAGAPQSPH
jgi:hypothetical protein